MLNEIKIVCVYFFNYFSFNHSLLNTFVCFVLQLILNRQ